MIGGRVIDASALTALVRGRISAMAWFDTAWARSLPLYLPTLALAEVRAVRPDAAAQLAEILGHPWVVLGELDAATAAQVDQLLFTADVFDACAGHIVQIARSQGWPVLTDDHPTERPAAPYRPGNPTGPVQSPNGSACQPIGTTLL